VKVKATPADFLVEEEAGGTESASGGALSDRRGEYAVFRLSKTSWDTFDLVDLLARKWGISRADIGLGGFKDRHGNTAQRISVRGLKGKPASIEEKNFTAFFLGWSDTALTARDIRGNRFTITLRDLSPHDAGLINANAPEVARDGIPDYFDTQRFGSARHGAGFMGKEMFLGRREKALRLYFTASRFDDRKTRALKRCVIENWGRWEKCAGMGFGEYGRILAYLAGHRNAFHQALEMIDRRFLVFVLNAYQSFLFNELLARWLRELAAESSTPLSPLRYPFGVFRFYHELTAPMADKVRDAVLPVPGYDTVCEDPRVGRIMAGVLEEEGIGLADLRIRQMRKIDVGGVMRPAVVMPEDFSQSPPESDDLYAGKLKTTLRFFLPRGAYATLVIKRLSLARSPLDGAGAGLNSA
jgi:tRNA pseudouridine13 synthase